MSSCRTNGLNTSEVPFVSVVVPVLNDQRRVALCIEALLEQTYPRDRYEVIVVDNGSTDETRPVIGRYPVTCLVEDSIQSSYAARNKGVAAARGAIIAFTDADCLPTAGWIEEGVRALDAGEADLAGGNVRFVYSARPSSAEVYDALSNMQQERNIRDRQVAKTANLFVRAGLFETVGRFPDAMQSGADVYWTQRATTLGYALVYARDAEVAHPTRRLRELLKKQYRVGRGRYDRNRLERATRSAPTLTLRPIVEHLRPPRWANLRGALGNREPRLSSARLLHVWSVGWLCRLTTAFGSIRRWSEYRVSEPIQAIGNDVALPERPVSEP